MQRFYDLEGPPTILLRDKLYLFNVKDNLIKQIEEKANHQKFD